MPSILDLIPYGKENAVTKKSLMKALNKGDKPVRDLITAERKKGNAILSFSNSSGYFRPYPDDEENLEHYVREAHHRVDEILENIEPAVEMLRDLKKKKNHPMPGQQKMDIGA